MSVRPAATWWLVALMISLAACGTPSGDESTDDAGEGTTTSAEEVLGRVDVVALRDDEFNGFYLVRSDGSEISCTIGEGACADGKAVFTAAPAAWVQCSQERNRSGMAWFWRHEATRSICASDSPELTYDFGESGPVASCTGCAADDIDIGGKHVITLSPSVPVADIDLWVFDFSSAVERSFCYLDSSGYARCGGRNWVGGLGQGRPNTLDDIGFGSLDGCSAEVEGLPQSCLRVDYGDKVELGGKVLDVQNLGGGGACALRDGGDVFCWGMLGHLGYEFEALGLAAPYCSDAYDSCAFVGDDELPLDAGALPVGFPVAEVAVAGHNVLLTRNDAGEVWLLGCPERVDGFALSDEQTGESMACNTATPRTRVLLSEPAVEIHSSRLSGRACATLQSGAIECFGEALPNNSGDWDSTNPPLQDAATAILPLPGPAKFVAERMVLLEDGRLFVYSPFEGKPGPAWGWAELDPDAYEWPQVCEPGTGRECPCGPGAVMEGIEECRDDGTGYLGCACPDRLCNPGAEDWCECDGGYWGFRVCGVDGESYTECQCAEKVDCCTSSNSCGKGGNGSCDCEGAFAGSWDQADCEAIAGVTTGSCAGLTPPEGYVCVPGGTYRDDPAYGGMGEEHSIPTLFVQRVEATYADFVGTPGIYPPGMASENPSVGCEVEAWMDHYGDELAARCLSLWHAGAECEADCGRLPTEWEWEWIARGRDEARTYPWGNEPPTDQACWRGDDISLDEPCLPAASPADGATRDGVLGMAGGVAEWTSTNVMNSQVLGWSDCLPGPYEGQGAGPDTQCYVVRGGSYHTTIAAQLQTQTRDVEAPSFGHLYIGYRCVREVP